jgi:hypothetical protein
MQGKKNGKGGKKVQARPCISIRLGGNKMFTFSFDRVPKKTTRSFHDTFMSGKKQN